MNRIVHEVGIDGARRARGSAVVIDTFRAFTTAAVLLDRDISRLIVVAGIGDARRLATLHGAILCGEDHGVRAPGFDLGNSPIEAHQHTGVTGRVVIMRTSAGTRSLLAAMSAGAAPVFAASLATASATARAVGELPMVTIVAAGLHGTEPAEEDDLTAGLIDDLIHGRGDLAAVARQVSTCQRADELRSAAWAHPDDADFASKPDRFDFAMQAIRADELVELVAVDS